MEQAVLAQTAVSVELLELAVLLAPAETAVMAVMAVTPMILIAKAALAVKVELVVQLV
jgi:hypothetical protein